MRRCVYLHGLGTGPTSLKGRELQRRLGPLGVEVDQPDLRRPSPTRLRLDAMIESALSATPAGVDLLVGASLGGWLALHVARVRAARALLLLAPAVSVHRLDVERPWVARAWRTIGLPVLDKASRRLRRVDPMLLDEIVAHGAPPAPQVPVVIVHGRRDRWARLEASQAYAAAHPGVRLIAVEDGHLLGRHLHHIVSLAGEALGLAPELVTRSSAAERVRRVRGSEGR